MRLLGTTLIGLLILASCANQGASPTSAVAQPAVLSYDGVYAGDMDKVTAGDPKLCGGVSHKTLHVTGGVGTIVGESDTRTGTVAADGTLKLSGIVGVAPSAYNASLTGQFTNNSFRGTSSVGPYCKYEWTLTKT
jgi:hypothetical protein